MKLSLREEVASAIAGGLLAPDSANEAPVDILGAFARCDPLGTALWRVTGNMDPSAFIRARTMLVEKLSRPTRPLANSLLARLAQHAMEEWLTRSQPSGAARMKALGIGRNAYYGLSHVFVEAARLLRVADGRVAKQMAAQLERK